jgi:hypothetical protein
MTRATQYQIDTVANWGFRHIGAGVYQRDIYADQGYAEIWTEAKPNVIEFSKNGVRTEDYKIDWSLF